MKPLTAVRLAQACKGGEGHEAHLSVNGECPWCGAHDGMTEEEAQAILPGRVGSDDEAVGKSEDLAELMRNAGVTELPDERDYGTAWDRHDDPQQQP
jgi:hypothetical protein